MTDEQKALHRARGYVLGDEVVQPQVIQLNGVVVNQAVMEFINLFAAFKPYQPYLVYDALKPAFMAVEVGHVPGCLPCSRRGTGDSQVEEINHVDRGIETNTLDILCEQSTTGGSMAKPIPPNPHFRKRTTSGQVTRKKPVAPPPVTQPVTTSQKDTPSRSLDRVAQAQPTATRQPLSPPPVKPPQITAQTTPTRRGALRNWLSHLPRLF
jgi:hypothetical protein